jgi:DMSO/TMAO reductase YedYZ molybdopterin-dependent catalytic subunit
MMPAVIVLPLALRPMTPTTLPDEPLTIEELQLAARNRGMPLEALRYDVTPTGLHYLLVHFDIPYIDAGTWRLEIGGAVAQRLTLSLDEIRALPQQTIRVTMECAGNGRARFTPRPLSQPWLYEAIGTADWTGTPVWPLLERAGISDDAVEVVFTGADHGTQGDVEHDYARSLTLAELRRPEVLLVHAMNGQALEPQHGFPLRLLVPGWYGMTSVKWLKSIAAVREPFDGYQQGTAYRYQVDDDDPGQPVDRIRVRALMVPPGVPDFFSRHRIVDAGETQIVGRAWSGVAPVTSVEVGVDGEWSEAQLDPRATEFAWQAWRFTWQAERGEHVVACRATDGAGNVQPLDQQWNTQGMGNNSVQTVAVTVR